LNGQEKLVNPEQQQYTSKVYITDLTKSSDQAKAAQQVFVINLVTTYGSIFAFGRRSSI
jgi:hypothetical protein